MTQIFSAYLTKCQKSGKKNLSSKNDSISKKIHFNKSQGCGIRTRDHKPNTLAIHLWIN